MSPREIAILVCGVVAVGGVAFTWRLAWLQLQERRRMQETGEWDEYWGD